MTDVKTDMKDMQLNKIAEGFDRYTIKYPDTEENKKTHEAFKDFCRTETDNNYTLGIRKLLEYYQSDFKYEMIYDRLEEQAVVLQELKASVIESQSKPKEDNTEESEAF